MLASYSFCYETSIKSNKQYRKQHDIKQQCQNSKNNIATTNNNEKTNNSRKTSSNLSYSVANNSQNTIETNIKHKVKQQKQH